MASRLPNGTKDVRRFDSGRAETATPDHDFADSQRAAQPDRRQRQSEGRRRDRLTTESQDDGIASDWHWRQPGQQTNRWRSHEGAGYRQTAGFGRGRRLLDAACNRSGETGCRLSRAVSWLQPEVEPPGRRAFQNREYPTR